MIIHLLRHGIAINRTDPGCPEDAARFLTKRGRRRTKEAVKGLRKLGITADLVFTSPFVRARETAEIAARGLRLETTIRESDALRWDAHPERLREHLRALAETDSVLCTGHAPQLDLFIAHMVGTPMPVTELKKSGFASISSDFTDPGDAVLEALYPPQTLRRLA